MQESETTTTTETKSETKTEPKSDTKTKPVADGETKESSESAPSGFARGERQKAVTEAYRNNWNHIFGRRRRSNKRQ